MKHMKTTILAGIAALALAGTAYAGSRGPVVHTMRVKTPNGTVATIEYTGNVAPTVRFGTVPMRAAFFGTASPFAAFDRISLAMNREMNVLLRQANMLTVPFAMPNALYDATLNGRAPMGHVHSMMARFSGSGVCMRAMQITRTDNGRPHVVTQTSGDCNTAGHAGLTGAGPALAPRNGHGMLEAVGKAHVKHKLPMFYEAGYTPH